MIYRGYRINTRYLGCNNYQATITSKLGYEAGKTEIYHTANECHFQARLIVDSKYTPAPMEPPTEDHTRPWSHQDYLEHGMEFVRKTNPELLEKAERGSVITEQKARIEALTAALHTALAWTDELVAERDAKIRRFKDFVSFADYWTVMNEEGEVK